MSTLNCSPQFLLIGFSSRTQGRPYGIIVGLTVNLYWADSAGLRALIGIIILSIPFTGRKNTSSRFMALQNESKNQP